MKFQPKTRGGYAYRILADDLPGEWPMALWIDDGRPNGVVERFSAGGMCASYTSNYDLLLAPQVIYVNIYEEGTVGWYPTREAADKYMSPDRIARKRVTFNPGEFDE